MTPDEAKTLLAPLLSAPQPTLSALKKGLPVLKGEGIVSFFQGMIEALPEKMATLCDLQPADLVDLGKEYISELHFPKKLDLTSGEQLIRYFGMHSWCDLIVEGIDQLAASAPSSPGLTLGDVKGWVEGWEKQGPVCVAFTDKKGALFGDLKSVDGYDLDLKSVVICPPDGLILEVSDTIPVGIEPYSETIDGESKLEGTAITIWFRLNAKLRDGARCRVASF